MSSIVPTSYDILCIMTFIADWTAVVSTAEGFSSVPMRSSVKREFHEFVSNVSTQHRPGCTPNLTNVESICRGRHSEDIYASHITLGPSHEMGTPKRGTN
ncbi:hypothetical protein N7G274_007643 [Stereocaulon virgatum]|uniref:Uncharacterized protein n=1 Tax=Stereocaulon virgatum TaxID=373712 RepID=A0ABR4A4V8_9LECA